ncbi:MAG: hypothetical protein RLZZ142_724 [Verrucomicrobiota bacterium]
MSPHLNRRRFLCSAGTLLALPMLESFSAASEVKGPAPRDVDPHAKAKRLVCIGAYLGLHTPVLYPTQTGLLYETTRTLQPLEALRGQFTLFSGLDHRAPGNHGNWPNYLCGKTVGDVSLDQRVAKHLGTLTRYPSIVLSAGTDDGPPMSYGQPNVGVPSIDRPSVLYRKLFVAPSELERQRNEYLLKSGQSILDLALSEAKSLQRAVSTADKEKLEEYFTSVREVEQRIGSQLNRLHEPTPSTDYRIPEADPIATNQMLECESIMYDLMALALQSDSTRVFSLRLAGLGQLFTLRGKTLKFNYHSLSHHGKAPEKIEELVQIDVEHMRLLARFLDQLRQKKDAEGRPLLEQTLVMWGTGMGDASRHSNDDLPTIVAGGGLRHQGHLAFRRTASADKDILLGDLFITLQRQLGIACDQFSQAKQGIDALIA